MSADSHGNTPAAWTGVSVAMIGFVVAGIGLMLSPINMVVFWIGMAFLPLSLVVWRAMEKMGMGTAQH
ncbi:Membrane protein [metagenome]|uniref:Membrane protein n=1 Tax=metagenome TaxID=256318 RepID=A0A2P2C030_9ZZZZ